MPIDVNAIWEEVKANKAKLDACEGPHDLQPDESTKYATAKDGGAICRKYKCTRCGGLVDSVNAHWYIKGLTHGRAHVAS